MALRAQHYVMSNFQFRPFPGGLENGCMDSDAKCVPYPSRIRCTARSRRSLAGRKSTMVCVLDTEVSSISSSRRNKVDPQPLRDAS